MVSSALSQSHSKRRTTSIIVTTMAAPKTVTNQRSPCAAARPQPTAASAESAASSRTRGFFQCSLCMSSRSDEYRHRAAEAKNRAARTSDLSIKSAFEEVARNWLVLAEQMEWIEGRTSSLLERHDQGKS